MDLSDYSHTILTKLYECKKEVIMEAIKAELQSWRTVADKSLITSMKCNSLHIQMRQHINGLICQSNGYEISAVL